MVDLFCTSLTTLCFLPIKEDSGSGGGLGGPFIPQAETAGPIAIIKKIIIDFFTISSQPLGFYFIPEVFNQTLKVNASLIYSTNFLLHFYI